MQRNEIDFRHIGHQCKRFDLVHVTKVNDVLPEYRTLPIDTKNANS